MGGKGAAIVDYDCTVDYPPSWEGPRPDRVDPSVVGGNWGNTGDAVGLRTVSSIVELTSAVTLFAAGVVRARRRNVPV